MRKIIVTTFMTLDGVLQAPGGPEEDRRGGFKWGGWQFPFSDDVADRGITRIMSTPFDLLLGRRTYEIFAAHWPYQKNEIGDLFNSIHKYVVGTTPIDLSWEHSTQIKSDVVKELTKLKKQDGPDLLVHGSSLLIQTLLANKLVDVLHIWIHPLTLGKGKKLFQDGTQAQEWKLTESVVSTTGVFMATYVPAGEVRTGTFSTEEASKPELARRERWAKGE